MNNKNNIKKNYIYSLILQVLSIVIPMITTPYLSRILRPSGIGAYDFINSLVSYFILAGVMGLGTYGQLEIAKCKDDKEARSTIFHEIMLIRTVTHLLSVFVFVLWVCFFSTKYKYLLLAQGVFILASMIDITWFFQGIEDFGTVALYNTVIKLLSLILIFVLVKDKSDLLIYTFIMSASTFLCNVSFYITIPKYVKKISVKSLSLIKHIKGALVFFIPSIASVIITYMDKTMIGLIVHSEKENGYYAQAYKIEMLCFSLFSALLIVMRSRMAYLSNKGDKNELSRLLTKSLRFVSFLVIPISFGTIAITNNFVPWFFGDEYEKVKILLPIFAIWLIVKAHSNCMLEEYIMAIGKQKIFNIIIWIGTIFNVVCNAILIPFTKSIGAAVASLLAEIIIFILAYYWSKEEVSLVSLFKKTWKYYVAAAVMGIVVFTIGHYSASTFFVTFLQIVIGLLIYCIILLLSKDELLKEVFRKIEGFKH